MKISEINNINDQIENDEAITLVTKKKLIDEAITLSQALDEPAVLARSLVNLATYLLSTGEPSSANEKALEAMKIAEELQLHNIKRRLCNLLGNINSYYGRYNIALNYYHQSLRLSQQLEIEAAKSVILNNIAILYGTIKMNDRAVEYYLEAQKSAEREHNYRLYFLITHNIINLYFDGNNLEQAKTHMSKMEAMLTLKPEVKEYVGITFLNKAKIAILEGKLKHSLEVALNGLYIFEEIGDIVGINEARLLRSKIYFEMFEYERAFEIGIKLCEEAERQAEFELEREARMHVNKIAQYMEINPQIEWNYKRIIVLDEQLLSNLYQMSLYQHEERIDIELQQQLKNNTDRLIENMKFINEVSKDISKELNYDALIKIIIGKLASFVQFDALVIGLYDKNREVLFNRITYEKGVINQSYDVPLSNKSSMGTWVVRKKRDHYTGYLSHMVLDDFEALHKNFKDITVPYETVYYAPLIDDEEVIGVFSLQKYTINGFDHLQIDMLRAIASYIAIAVANALKTAKMRDLNEQLKTISKKDGLSQLLNRYALNEDAKPILSQFNDQKMTISTLMCDIDYFKEYNDYYGHVEGDNVIIKVAQILTKICLDYTPYIYRYGGDEFLVVFQDLEETKVESIAYDILKSVDLADMPHTEKGIGEKVTISIGLAHFSPSNELLNEDDLLRGADISLYISKRKGRNQVRATKF